jgi:hypothetical protein
MERISKIVKMVKLFSPVWSKSPLSSLRFPVKDFSHQFNLLKTLGDGGGLHWNQQTFFWQRQQKAIPATLPYWS